MFIISYHLDGAQCNVVSLDVWVDLKFNFIKVKVNGQGHGHRQDEDVIFTGTEWSIMVPSIVNKAAPTLVSFD